MTLRLRESSRLRYRLLPVTSRVIPESVLRWLGRHWKVGHDPADGWTYWLDASYARYVRRHLPSHPELGEDLSSLDGTNMSASEAAAVADAIRASQDALK